MQSTTTTFCVFWRQLLRLLLLKLLIAIPLVISQSSSSSSSYNGDEDAGGDDGGGFQELVAWMKQHGGRVADGSFQIQQQPGTDGIRGGVATVDIAKGSELLYCPWDLVIGGGTNNNSQQQQQQQQHGQMKADKMCSIVRRIDQELRLGKDSRWYYYLKLHHNDVMKTRLTSFWSQAALEQLQGLSPQEDGNRHVQWLLQDCGVARKNSVADDSSAGSEQQQQQQQQQPQPQLLFASEFMQEALILFLTRATAVGMVPIYDLFNHHNGHRNCKLLETKTTDSSSSVDGGGGGGVQLMALQDIKKGNALYISYGIKSASTMFRDYGFVESWPQLWTWTDHHQDPDVVDSQQQQQQQQHRHTMALLDDMAVIYPSREFLQEFWQRTSANNNNNNNTLLSSFQEMGIHHNSLLLSRNELEIFAASAANLIDARTTVEEDLAILSEMKYQLAHLNLDNSNNKTLVQKLRQTLLRLLSRKEAENKTTVQQQQQQQQAASISNNMMILMEELSDSIRAVEYRIQFKQAVQIGLDTALRILSSAADYYHDDGPPQQASSATTVVDMNSEL